MKKTILVFLLLICFVLIISSCSKNKTPNTEGSKIYNPGLIGSNDEIIISSGIIPGNLNIIGVKDNKNFYCLVEKDLKNIYLYNSEKKTITLIKSAISSDKYIKTILFSDDWMIWTEDESKVETDELHEKNWCVYAQNLKTGQFEEVDKYKEIKLDPNSIYKTLEPREFSLSNGMLVFDGYDKLEDGTICAVIKMYDLTNKSMKIIDANKNYINEFYSHPKISGEFLVWSLSKCNITDYSEKGSTYLYNIKNKQKTLISKGDEILWPYIYGNNIVARVKPKGQNENSSLVSFDLCGGNVWNTVVSPNSYMYKDKAHIEIGMHSLNGQYLMWRDNVNSSMDIYNFTDKKFYNIAELKEDQGRIMPIGIYNKILFWYETIGNKNTIKYVILK